MEHPSKGLSPGRLGFGNNVFFVLVIIFWLMQTVEEIYKVASIALSPNVSAQIFVRLFC